MCMVYFLGSDSEVPRTPAWDENHPAFYVGDPSADEMKLVREKLPHQHIRFLGSHEGCGCGFRCEHDGFLFGREGEEAFVEASDHIALVVYLRSLPSQERPMQIFGCWSGDEGEEVAYRRECTIAELGSPTFAFREREVITLRP